VRAIADRRNRGEQVPNPAYRELFAMACGERSYPVRLAIAQEIRAGGATAFVLLHDDSDEIWNSAAWPEDKAGAKDKCQRQEGKTAQTRTA
jgi:hypothetical protein